MKSTVLSLVSCLVASAATLLGSRPAMAADFSKAGSVSVAIERTFGIHYVNDTYDPDGPVGSDSSGGTTIGFGWYGAGSPLHYARAAVDVFVIDRLSVGGSLGFFTQTGNDDTDGVLLAPRVGYSIELSQKFTFWPRGGLTFLKFENGSLFGLNAEAMFVAWPRPNWGVLLGATLDIDFIGDYGAGDWSQFSLGIPSVGLIATF